MQKILENKWVVPIGLFIILLMGISLRLYRLTEDTIDHVEVTTPGISLPEGLSIPGPMYSVRDIVTEILIVQDPNPIGYYVMMLGWGKVFGTGIFMLRLPSVLFGVGCILLVYFVAKLTEDAWTALLAAAMLAFNGHQIYWSQIAKMYSMGCFLGLLSTLFLLLASTKVKNQRIYIYLYGIATLAGLATVVYFWLLFVGQILWCFIKWVQDIKVKPGMLRWQVLLFIIASPLFSLAVFQARRESYLDPNIWPQLVEYLQFGFLFEKDYNAVLPQSTPWILGAFLLILALILLLWDLRPYSNRKPQKFDIGEYAGPQRVLLALATTGAFLFILRMAKFTYGFDPVRTRLVLASSVLPLILLMVDVLIRNDWVTIKERIKQIIPSCDTRFTLPSMLAIFPVMVIVLLSFFVPLFASRTVMLFTPFLLIILASGLIKLIRRKSTWALLLPVLAILFGSSYIYYQNAILEHPTDYKGLAQSWLPHIEDGDIIFVQRHWATTPIFYYLDADEHQVIASHYSDTEINNPNARIWVLSFPGMANPVEMESALYNYLRKSTITARNILCTLYIPSITTGK